MMPFWARWKIVVWQTAEPVLIGEMQALLDVSEVLKIS